jgi:dolichol-phosphate mannosyltransferase
VDQDISHIIAIVLYTYNDTQNINDSVPLFENILREERVKGYFIIIDDNSSDGTREVALNLARKYRNIILIQRPGRLGIASAFRLGFKYGLDLGAEKIITIEPVRSNRVNFQRFIKNIMSNEADLILGTIDPFRDVYNPIDFLLSSYSRILNRLLLGLPRKINIGSFYRAYNTSALKKIDLNKIANGIAFIFDIIFKAQCKSLKIDEVPLLPERLPLKWIDHHSFLPSLGRQYFSVLVKNFFNRILVKSRRRYPWNEFIHNPSGEELPGINQIEEQLKLPAGYDTRSDKMLSLNDIISTYDSITLSNDLNKIKDMIKKRILSMKNYSFVIAGGGAITKTIAIKEIESNSILGRDIMNIELRIIKFSIEIIKQDHPELNNDKRLDIFHDFIVSLISTPQETRVGDPII